MRKTPALRITKAVKEQFGEAFHTGLRRGVDSQHSAVAWKAVKNATPGVWDEFCNHMLNRLPLRAKLSEAAFKRRLKKFEPLDDYGRDDLPGVKAFTEAITQMPKEDETSLFAWLVWGFQSR